MRNPISHACLLLAVSGLIFTAELAAQEKPLSIEGTFSSGFYSSYTRGGGNEDQRIQFVPAGITFEINGYYLSPDLLDLWFQPQFNAGPQASDAGFLGGNGVRMRVQLLRRRAFPLTFRYSNVELEDVYFGSLSRVSSYTLKNRNKDLGVSTQLRPPGLPATTIDWGVSSVDSASGITTIPDYQSRTEHINADSSYVRWGWEFHGFAHHQKQTSDLITPAGGEPSTSSLEQEVMQYQGSARRSLPSDSELYVDAGSQSTSNRVLDRPIDLTTRYASANLRLFQRGRWKVSLRAAYTSNITGLLFNQFIGGLGAQGSIAPDTTILTSTQNEISNLNLNALTTLNLSHGFGLYASLDRTGVFTTGNGSLRSSYFTTAGGITYAASFGWGNLSGQYGREYGTGSVTGQTGILEGQTYVVSFQRGNVEGLQLGFSLHGNDQIVRNANPASNHSFSVDGSVGHSVFGRFNVRLGGGRQRSTFTNAGTQFHTEGYTAHASIEHPRLQINASLNTSIGNSLQSYSQLLGGIGAESALLTPIHLVPSDLRGMTFTLRLNPTRKLELSGLWTRSIQHLEGVVANDFEIIDVRATYPFRRLQFELGLFRSRQIFSSYLATYPLTERGRIYFRVVRKGKFL